MLSSTNRIIVIITFLLIFAFPLTAQNQGRILIVYFTWAENTEIIDLAKAIQEANNHVFSVENTSSPDTLTSASVIPPGNTTKLAFWIKEMAGGDLYSIKVKNKYSCYWDECLNRASKEKARRSRPELIDRVHNISDYDVIFLGFPNWLYTIPMPIATFVESHDLSNKKIIPFVSHGTSGLARTIRDLKSLLPSSASVEKPLGVYRSETNNAQSEIEEWLKELGYAN